MIGLNQISNLPGPVKAVGLLAGGAGIMSVVMAVAQPNNPFWKILAVGIVSVAVLIALFVIILKLRDKAKSGPFASLIAKAGAGRGAVDPAQKARMDDLRKKFEEGVTTFKSAGKDLYSLPWYLLVGPSGSGKTEAMRHCNVGFPPGLQDCLQGSGGTLNMHWWFTNNAVVLDTAGRMFMEESAEGGSTEWKEFMKLLKQCRPNAPINGLLLVISSESLLKDSAEKIEQTAGAIARQLDVVQRTLDVRFPVFVVVTKCDKIVGFRDFFETVNDPSLQHQMLGWSNPAPLDEAFKPDQVDKHLETVRQKLLKRRMGLLQNPIHTSDASSRRTDQVDELFELPDNLVRIAPRLRRYLEMIFVAGEWSPKPLFLRGIFFTSSMREGQALDMTLASALGVDVESIPTGREWDKEKAYFLRDVFLSKVFKERGLVTRATNVSKQLAKQRRLLVGGSLIAVVLLIGVTVLGAMQFRSSLGPPSKFWAAVRDAYAGNEVAEVEAQDLVMIASNDKGWAYRGGEDVFSRGFINDEITTRLELLDETSRWAGKPIDPPIVAMPIAPFLGFRDGFADDQIKAHRAVVENSIVGPLVRGARSKLQTEEAWGADAVGALAQLVRLQTYAFGGKPVGVPPPAATDVKLTKPAATPAVAMDVDALFKYVLGPTEYKGAYQKDRDDIMKAVAAAYPKGWDEEAPSAALGGKEAGSVLVVDDAVDRLVKHLLSLGASTGSDMERLKRLFAGLGRFREEERVLLSLQWLKTGGAEGGAPPADLTQYAKFESAYLERVEGMTLAKAEIDPMVEALTGAPGEVLDPIARFAKAGEALQGEMAAYFQMLRAQLPAAPEPEMKVLSKEPQELVDLRTKLDERAKQVASAVQTELDKMGVQVREAAPLLLAGRADRVVAMVYAVRYDSYRLAMEEVKAAAVVAAPEVNPATGLAPSFTSQIERVEAATGSAATAIGAWSSWTPDSAGRFVTAEQQTAVLTERDGSVRAARKAVEIAQSRRMYELAKAAVRDWPQEGPEVSKRVKQVADVRVNEGAYKKWTQPLVPMTEMADGGEFAREYHPDAAKEVLGDWSKLKDLIDPTSSGQTQMIGREALKVDGFFRGGAQGTSKYVQTYIEYWRGQALEASKPAVESWADFAGKMKLIGHFDLKDELSRLHETVDSALKVLPESPAWNTQLGSAKQEVTAAFAGLENATFVDETKATLAQWKRLCSSPGGAAGARETLLTAYTNGKAKEQYFTVYRTAGGRTVKYWNDLLMTGLTVLVKETEGELKQAWDVLVRSSKGVPLAFGTDLKHLKAKEVTDAYAAAQKLDALAASAADSGGDDMDEELRTELAKLSGADFVARDAGTRTWFTRLKGVLKVVAAPKPASITVSYWDGSALPRRGGIDARETYKYAGLRVGGVAKGRPFSFTVPIVDPEALRIELPTPAGQTTEIYLYIDDPATTGKLNEPDLKIPSASEWSLMGEMLASAEPAVWQEATKTWRVLAATPDGKTYLWLNLKFDPDVPVQAEWPRAEQWPLK